MKHRSSLIFFLLFFSLIATSQELSKNELERNQAAAKIYKQEDPGKKEKLYKEWVQKYPPALFPRSLSMYDYVQGELGKAYASHGQVEKALYYAGRLEMKSWRSEGWAEIAAELAAKGYLTEAGGLYRAATDDARASISSEKDSTKKEISQHRYRKYNYELAVVLFRQQKYAQSLLFAKEAYLAKGKPDLAIDLQYAEVLIALQKNEEALDILEKMLLQGLVNPKVKKILKETFLKSRPAGLWEEYIKVLTQTIHDKRKEELRSAMINIPAPAFTLNDLDGNIVSLEDYKGKMVILDFWATWCVPCRQSFPVMQKAVDQYKDRTDIHFLFIHTWERETHAVKAARDFIKKYNYSFHVLMDLKDPVTEVNNTVENYKVGALPKKMLVDKNGNIRFIIDSAGDPEHVLEELSIMLELAGEQ